MNNKRISVIGAGSWGTALSLLLAKNGYYIDLWVYEKDLCQELKEKRTNSLFLPNFHIPKSIYPTNSLKDAIQGNQIILLVVPSHVVRKIANAINPFLNSENLIINAGKGIENNSLSTIRQILKDTFLNKYQVATLSGPTFAIEIAKEVPSAIVAAADTTTQAEQIQNIFSCPYLKVFTSIDPFGVEIGGALKNVIAIATGICDGLNVGNNARAALITRGLNEISRIGVALGAKPNTFYGLSGLGDLVLTCTGKLSRNRNVGIRIGQGENIDNILKSMDFVAEGILTVKSAYDLKSKLNVQASIIDEIYKIIYESKSPQKAVKDLMNTKTTTEFIC